VTRRLDLLHLFDEAADVTELRTGAGRDNHAGILRRGQWIVLSARSIRLRQRPRLVSMRSRHSSPAVFAEVSMKPSVLFAVRAKTPRAVRRCQRGGLITSGMAAP